MLLGSAYFLQENFGPGVPWLRSGVFVVFAVFLEGVLGKVVFRDGFFADRVW
jgi:hypothetical protein